MLTLLKNEITSFFSDNAKRTIAPIAVTTDAKSATGKLPLANNHAAVANKFGPVPEKSMLHRALSEEVLLEAWRRVKENDGAAGVDGQQIEVFARNVLGRLQQLKSEVERGQYIPQPLMEIDIAKPDGRLRTLCIPSVRDRVLQTAVAQVMGKRLDPEFADISYAYRPQRCSAQAVARVSRLREAGLVHVLDADIEGYFDSIDHRRLLSCERWPKSDGIWGLTACYA